MKKPVFTGSAVAIATPFNAFGEIDYVSFSNLVSWQIESGTQAIVVLGTTGENSTVTDEEFKRLVSTAVEVSAKRVPIIAGTGRNDTAHSISLSKTARELGADALLVVSPYYNKTTQAGLVAHITAIADSVNLPIILYNVPSRTGMSFSASTYQTLSKHPNINGVKEASGNFTLLLQTLALCDKDFFIYCGNDDQITAMLSLGAVGVVSVLANIAPKETQEICTRFFDGDIKGSCNLQIKYCHLLDALFIETNPIPVKAALQMMGRCEGHLRLPLVEISQSNKQILKTEMQKLGII